MTSDDELIARVREAESEALTTVRETLIEYSETYPNSGKVAMRALDTLARRLEEAETVIKAAEAYEAKVTKLQPEIDGMFAFAANHGFRYIGETYESERAALREALSLLHPEPQETKQ